MNVADSPVGGAPHRGRRDSTRGPQGLGGRPPALRPERRVSFARRAQAGRGGRRGGEGRGEGAGRGPPPPAPSAGSERRNRGAADVGSSRAARARALGPAAGARAGPERGGRAGARGRRETTAAGPATPAYAAPSGPGAEPPRAASPPPGGPGPWGALSRGPAPRRIRGGPVRVGPGPVQSRPRPLPKSGHPSGPRRERRDLQPVAGATGIAGPGCADGPARSAPRAGAPRTLHGTRGRSERTPGTRGQRGPSAQWSRAASKAQGSGACGVGSGLDPGRRGGDAEGTLPATQAPALTTVDGMK